jgi:hypothetical protein
MFELCSIHPFLWNSRSDRRLRTSWSGFVASGWSITEQIGVVGLDTNLSDEGAFPTPTYLPARHYYSNDSYLASQRYKDARKAQDYESETYVEPLQLRNAPISKSPSAKAGTVGLDSPLQLPFMEISSIIRTLQGNAGYLYA